jgi:thymidylate synthase (FAD)
MLISARKSAELISITYQTEFKIVEMARVSAPPSFLTGSQQESNHLNLSIQTATREVQSKRLIKYLIDHQHWSPFEMASMTVKITTTRDISRQILRHRSFSFQEFSQRYQDIKVLNEKPVFREARLQDTKNRQNSLPCESEDLQRLWHEQQQQVWTNCMNAYNNALSLGIAKEQARALLPEGLCQTQMYMTGSIRSWIHYLKIRTGPETQKEHRDVAQEIKKIFIWQLPIIGEAVFDTPFVSGSLLVDISATKGANKESEKSDI